MEKEGEPLNGRDELRKEIETRRACISRLGAADLRISESPISQPYCASCRFAVVPHGSRLTFRDWTGEEQDHPQEVIAVVLAHVVGNRVEAPYARSDLFERRPVLMDDWARYLARGIDCPHQAKKRQALIHPALQDASIGSHGTAFESSHDAALAEGGAIADFRLRGSRTWRRMGGHLTNGRWRT